MKSAKEDRKRVLDKRTAALACAIATAVFLILLGLNSSPSGAMDDAFVTFRYAHNLGRGMGLIYNSGEWVLGTTTPLFAVLLGGLSMLTPDVAWLAHWIGMLAWIVAVWAAMGLLWQYDRPYAAIVAGILLALQPLMLLSIGMETALVVALMLGAAWAWSARKPWIAVVAAAALILTRQDATLWVLLLGLEVWRYTRRFPLKAAFAIGLLTVPWFLYAYWRYGAILPNSALAKIGQVNAMAGPEGPSFGSSLLQSIQGAQGPLFLLVVLLLASFGIYLIATKLRPLWWLPVWLVAYVTIYSVLGVVSFTWYLVPPLATLAVLTALGLGGLLGDTISGDIQQDNRRRYVLTGLGLALTAVVVAGAAMQMVAATGQRDSVATTGRMQNYRAAGDWLAANGAPDAQVAAMEIGIIGYNSRLPILDTMGLISPAMRAHLTGWQDTLTYAVTTFWPEYFVALPDMPIVRQWWFADQYTVAEELGDVTLYRRNSRPEGGYAVPMAATDRQGLHLEQVSTRAQRLDSQATLDIWARLRIDQQLPANYEFTWSLIDAADQSRPATANLWPFGDFNLYQSSHWQPGDQLTVPFRLELPEDLPDGTYRLGLVVYDTAMQQIVPWVQAAGEPVDETVMGWFRAGDPAAPAANPQAETVKLDAVWANQVQLEAIRWDKQRAEPGASLPVNLTWRVLEQPERDLTVFVHLLNRDGEIVAQQDRKPFGGRFPTIVWETGESMTDQMELPVPAGLKADVYQLCIGLYDETGRLPDQTDRQSRTRYVSPAFGFTRKLRLTTLQQSQYFIR